jgi:hypothetical protein
MLLLDVNGACRMDLPIDFFDVADGDNKQVNANNFEYEMSDFESDCDSSSCT